MKKLNKKGVTFTKLMLSFLLFLFFMAAGFLLINDMAKTYDVDIEEQDILNTSENITQHLDETIDLIEREKDDITAQEIESGEDSWFSMLRGVYKVIKLPFTVAFGTLNVVGDVANAIAAQLGLPRVVIDVVIASITLIFLGIIIAKVFRFQES